MRIIAGKWGGRRLQAPTGRETRPTGDRIRESLFSSLHSRIGSFEGLRVLDAFAGSGVLGLEALSRGAVFLVSVEYDSRACRIIEANYLKLTDDAKSTDPTDDYFRLYRGDIFKVAPRLRDFAIDLAFFDPPYDLCDSKIYQLLDVLRQERTFSYGALIVIERPKAAQSEDMLPDGFASLDIKYKGDTSLHFVSFTPDLKNNS